MFKQFKSDGVKLKNLCCLTVMTIFLLLFIFYFYHYSKASTIMSVCMISSKKIEKMTYSDSILAENHLSLLCNDLIVPWDKSSQTFYLSQNMNTDCWQGALSLNSLDYYLYFAEDDFWVKKSESIRQGHKFTLYITDGTYYQPLSLVFTGLPLISMTTDSVEERSFPIEDVDNYYFNSETRYYGNISIFNTNPGTSSYQTISSNLCYHERGATSAIYEKKSYSLKLLEKDGSKNRQALFDLPQSGEWKLVNMFTDKSKIREMTSLQLWEEIASTQTNFDEHGALMSYCEVILDDVYMGLYGVLYPIDEETLELRQNDILYKILGDTPPSVSAFQHSMDNNYNVAYPVRLRYPKEYDNVIPYWEPMRNYLTYGYWSPDAITFSQLTDLRNIADFYIFIQAIAASDNQLKNTYMLSKYSENIDVRLTYIIPWDLNYSFGDCYEYDSSILYTTFNEDPTIVYAESCIKQLFDENIAGANTILKNRYNQLRQTTLSTEHIQELMKKNLALLVNSGAFKRESIRWPDSKNSPDINTVLQYVENRMAFLDTFFMQ